MEVDVPELGTVEFEDGTPQHVIDGAINDHFASQLRSGIPRSGPLSTISGGPPLSLPSGALRSTLGEVGEALGTAVGEDTLKSALDLPKLSRDQLRMLPDVNIGGINPAIAGGMWNSGAKMLEGAATPLGVAAMPFLAAKPLQPLVAGVFGGLGAKSGSEMLGALSGTPGLSTGERTEGYSDAAAQLLGSVGPFHEINPIKKTLTPAIKAFNIENPSEIQTFTGASHSLANDAAVKEKFMPTGRDQGFILNGDPKEWRSRQAAVPIFHEITGGKYANKKIEGLMSEHLRDAGELEHLKEAGKSPEGMVRVYHGEGGAKGGGTGGAWSSTDPNRAASFGEKVSYVDLPKSEVEKGQDLAKKLGSGTGSDVVLNNEHIKRLKPYGGATTKVHDLDIQGMRPGVKTIDGEKLIGKQGQVHDDIIADNNLSAKDIDRRIFVDKNGKELSREAAAAATGIPTETQAGRLHASELADEQDRLREELFKKYYGME